MVKRGNEAVMGPHHASSHTDAAADLAVEQKVMFVGDKPFFVTWMIGHDLEYLGCKCEGWSANYRFGNLLQ